MPKRMSATAGLIPGAPVFIGVQRTEAVRIAYMDFDEQSLREKEISNVEECFPLKDTPTVTWINIDGLHDTQVIEKIGSHFELHPLTLEDILNTGQRPKLDDVETYLFIVLKMLLEDKATGNIQAEQVSLVLGKNFVISFQEQQGDVFEAVRERIRTGKGRIRKMGADYLAYSLIDAVVDNYFVILEKLGESIEGVEDAVVKEPTPRTLQTIHVLKRDMIFLRKSLWPLRELINGMARGETKLIKKNTQPFLRDVYDHTIQVIDTLESSRDMVSGMLDVYLSSLSNRMNEVMKVLTIIATIFIPITFIAGIYGMNFNPEVSRFNMPELNWPYGYLMAWGVMLLIALVMIVYFKRRKWL